MRKYFAGLWALWWLLGAISAVAQTGPGFTAANPGTPISVTTGGVSGTLPPGSSVMATNVGAQVAYCQPGAAATTSSQPITPGTSFQFQIVPGTTQLTCITSTGTTTVNLIGGSGQGVVGNVGLPASQTGGGVTVANLVCDGTTDNAALLQADLNAAAAGNATTVYFPPQATPCGLASDVTVPDKVTLWAYPGSVTIKALTGNVSSPALLNFSGNPTGNLVFGLTFDEGGTSFANNNNVNTVFNSNNVIFDHVTVQNTAGIGVTFSTTDTNSGVRDSSFTNVGTSQRASFTGYISGTAMTVSSGLTGTIAVGATVTGSGVAAGTLVVSGSGNNWVVSISQTVFSSGSPGSLSTALQRQGVVFCCGQNLDTPGSTTSSISGTTLTTGNSVTGIIGKYIYSNGNGTLPDTYVVSGSGTSWVVNNSQTVSGVAMVAALNQGNFVRNSYFLNTALDSISYTQQRNFAAQNNVIVSPGIGGAGIYDHSNDTTTVTGNTVFGTTTNGNGIDLAATFHAVVIGNSSKGNGGSGIAYAYASDGTISGNVANNNGQNGTTGEGSSVAGLFLTGTLSPISNLVISANDFSDTQGTPTQRYGIEMQTASTFSNITIDPNNNYSNNVVQPLSSLLAPLPANLTNTTNPVSGGATATVTISIATPGVVTWTGHGLKCLAPVYLSTSGALPTGLSAFTEYFVTCGTGLVTANTFQLATTEAHALAGTSINTTGTQSGTQTGHISAIISSGSAFDIIGVPLAAGNYLCSGIAIPAYGGSTSVTVAAAWLSTTGASTLPYNNSTYATQTAGLNAGLTSQSEAAIVTPQTTLTTPSVHFSLTSAGMVVLAYEATYTVSSETVVASLTCTPSR